MKSIVPRGYAVPQSEIKRLADEVRAARAGELAGASEQDRVRIEEEILREVRGKIGRASEANRKSLHARLPFQTPW
jgi:hypothetical protein